MTDPRALAGNTKWSTSPSKSGRTGAALLPPPISSERRALGDDPTAAAAEFPVAAS